MQQTWQHACCLILNRAPVEAITRQLSLALTAKARAAGRAVLQNRADARAADLSATIRELQAAGCESLRAIAAEIQARGIPAARGGKWSAVQVARLLERIER